MQARSNGCACFSDLREALASEFLLFEALPVARVSRTVLMLTDESTEATEKKRSADQQRTQRNDCD